jgi:hypothetical protein
MEKQKNLSLQILSLFISINEGATDISHLPFLFIQNKNMWPSL